MTTNFPTSVDSFPDPSATDRLDNPPHDVLHTNVNSAVEAIETALLDGAPLHIDDTNERVGVGTTTPSTELEVDGTVTATEFVGHLQGPTHIQVKNTSGGSLSKGTPVYATGSVGASGAVEVQASLAGTASTMPALGLLDETLAHNDVGSATVIGVIRQVDTSLYSVNDELYVAVSGGLTATRPSGASELVQKIGRVVRSDASTGEILVLGAGRSNDVPNGLSPTITLAGDASGSVTLTNLGNGTLTVAVNDDSHNHTIANVDNLQTTLDGKAASSHSHSYLPLTGGTVTGQTTFSATDGVKLTGPSGGVWFDDRNGDGSKWVAYHSGSFFGLWNGSVTPFQFHDTGELLIQDTHSSELLDVYRTGSAPGNSVTALFRNQYANHSWGVIAEFRIEGNSGSDRPAVLFSSGQTSTTWTVGFDYNNDTFGIRQNRGYRNGGWGSSRLSIDTSGNVTIPAALNAYSFSGNSNVAGTGNAIYTPSGIYSTGTNWLYGTILTNGNDIGQSSQRVGQVWSNGWLRTVNATGWYNDTYGGGVYMTGSDYVRVYNSKGLETNKNASQNYATASIYINASPNSTLSFHPGGQAPQLRVGFNNNTVYFRNWADTGWCVIEASVINHSSRVDKQDISDFANRPSSLSSDGNSEYARSGTDIVRQLRPRHYRWDWDKNMRQLPLSQRRTEALKRLNAHRETQGLGEFLSDESWHVCGRDCDGTETDPCWWVKDWETGYFGFIAEEVGEVVPEAGRLSETTGELSGLDAMAMSAIIVASLQEVLDRLDALESANV